MERVIAYVDGYNLYFGLREKRWKHFYWLNIQAMAAHLLKAGQTLVATHYFTAVLQRPEAKRRRQAAYLEALGTLANCVSTMDNFSLRRWYVARAGRAMRPITRR